MSGQVKDGGAAFPNVRGEKRGPKGGLSTEPTEGMSLRDYFAAQALTTRSRGGTNYQRLAETAYDLADAMLAERERRRG